MFTYEAMEGVIRPKKVIKRSLWRTPQKISIDSRTISSGDGFLALRGKWHDGHRFIKEACRRGARFVIAQDETACRDVNACSYIVADPYRALEKISCYIRKTVNPRAIAVTGSIGKTTTKEIIAYLLQHTYSVLKNEKTENNFLGVSKTILRLADEEFIVLELGTNSPGEIKQLTAIVRPDIGVITYIKPVHTEKLPTLRDIFEEKKEIVTRYAHTKAVLNYDDPYLRKIKAKKKIVWFGTKKGATVRGRFLSGNEKETVFLINGKYKMRLKTPFRFYIYNTLAALGAVYASGEELPGYIAMMDEFGFNFPMRMEETRKRGMFFINDAYNSNPFALKTALENLDCYRYPKIAVIGDMRELGRLAFACHRHLAADILRQDFEYVLTLGFYSRVLKEKLDALGYRRAFHFASHDEVVAFLKKLSRKKYLVFVKGSRGMEMEKIIEKY
ncbi:MAG: UDP-N-acetylmuramoyl-tripeptide--D-alanyl-D-alanine ligase [Candidatus Omnitrophica bacterium]|nr:UDP-N-acetylmuramoyl-tripeptide--D-alanyl-D-alanine ligase [Candidatus Omnitrophota bacterium]